MRIALTAALFFATLAATLSAALFAFTFAAFLFVSHGGSPWSLIQPSIRSASSRSCPAISDRLSE
jgi:hypothetical protein